MRFDYIFKQFNKFDIKFLDNSMVIRGPVAENIFEFPKNVIQLTKNRYFFKSKAELFLFRALILNIINRSIQKHFKKLTLKGIGFKCYKLNNRVMLLKIGFTHKIYYLAANLDTTLVCKKGRLLVYGNDIDLVNNLAYEIKGLRQPDSYKGKGIIFTDEKIKLKSSKKRI